MVKYFLFCDCMYVKVCMCACAHMFETHAWGYMSLFALINYWYTLPTKTCNLRRESGISIITCDLWCLIAIVVYEKAFGTVFQFCSCQIPDLLHEDTNLLAALRNTFTATLKGNWEFLTYALELKTWPLWQVGHGNKGVSMLRQKLWIPTPRRLQLGMCNVLGLGYSQWQRECTPRSHRTLPAISEEKRSTSHRGYNRILLRKKLSQLSRHYTVGMTDRPAYLDTHTAELPL